MQPLLCQLAGILQGSILHEGPLFLRGDRPGSGVTRSPLFPNNNGALSPVLQSGWARASTRVSDSREGGHTRQTPPGAPSSLPIGPTDPSASCHWLLVS